MEWIWVPPSLLKILPVCKADEEVSDESINESEPPGMSNNCNEYAERIEGEIIGSIEIREPCPQGFFLSFSLKDFDGNCNCEGKKDGENQYVRVTSKKLVSMEWPNMWPNLSGESGDI